MLFLACNTPKPRINMANSNNNKYDPDMCHGLTSRMKSHGMRWSSIQFKIIIPNGASQILVPQRLKSRSISLFCIIVCTVHGSQATTFGSRGVSAYYVIFRFVSDLRGLFLQLSHARSAFRSDW